MDLNSKKQIMRSFRRYVTSGRVEFILFPLVIKLSAAETLRLFKNLESPPPPNAELMKSLALYEKVFGAKP